MTWHPIDDFIIEIYGISIMTRPFINVFNSHATSKNNYMQRSVKLKI